MAEQPRPPAPIDLSVYIADARLSISPPSVGAGPVILVVTNQASRTESLSITPAGSGSALALIGPISPQASAQMQVGLDSPGEYTIATAAAGNTDADLAGASRVVSARLHVGARRPSASGALLQP